MTDVPRLTGVRALGALMDLGFASIAVGVLARRRPVVRLLERMQADERAVTRMQKLRREFGSGPVELVIPGRRILVVLDPADVGRVLAGAPTPFHPANREKRMALRWFQPHGVLVSEGSIRDERRAFNEAVLQTGAPLHDLAEPFAHVIAEEAHGVLEAAIQRGQLDSAQLMTAWWRLVRRIVLGGQARDDENITDELWRLRSAGNWAFLSLPHHRMRARFTEHLYRYAERPDPNSLLGALADTPARGAVDPVGQVPHWLFAFDAAGMALVRALAVLATHPEHHALALQDAADLDAVQVRPYLRACILESVRLWPTTPTILRDTTEDTQWGRGTAQFTIGKGAGLMIVTPAFHRDSQLLPFADHFTPEIWLDGRAQQYQQLVPFSAGPAECPGRNLVLLTTSTLLAHLIGGAQFTLTTTPRPSPAKPLPMTLNQFTLDFGIDSLPVPREVSDDDTKTAGVLDN
jgi:cytochrome P450